MSKLRPAKPEEVMRALERVGFVRVWQSRSHAVLRHADGRWTTVPVHGGKNVTTGTLHKILRDARITPEEFEQLK